MHDSSFVRRRQPLRHLYRIVDRLANRQRPFVQACAQRLPIKQLHYCESYPVRAAEVVDAEDVRVRQGGDGPRLALEAGQSLRVLSENIRQDLDGNLPVQVIVVSPVYDSHAPLADPLEERVVQKSAAHKVISILIVFSQRLGGFFHGGRFDEDFGFVIAGEKRFHFLAFFGAALQD